MNQPRLEDRPDGVVVIWRGERRAELHGLVARRVAVWHQYQLTRGPEWAAIYLTGVIDGMAVAWDATLPALSKSMSVEGPA